MGEVIVRIVNSNDYEKIVQIKNYYIENTNVIFTNEKLSVEDIKKEIDINEKVYLVAEYNGEVIGFSCLSKFRHCGYYITKEISVYLSENATGFGVGSLLIKEALDKGKMMDLKNIVAFISTANTRSLKLFQKLGFKRCGALYSIAHKNDEYLNVEILQIQLK